MALDHHHLIRLGGATALLGGLLRFVSTFIPWIEASQSLELFYLITDLCLLFGLITIFLARAGRLGIAGLIGFVASLSAQSAIVGPDHTPFGIDVYGTAIMIISLGIALLSIDIIRTRSYPLFIPALWISSPLIFFGYSMAGAAPYGWGYIFGGILFSLGFVAAGVVLIRHPFPD